MRYRLLSLFLLWTAFGMGCDEAVTPPEAIEAYFTLWGALDPEAEVQAVRVVPLMPDLDSEVPRDLQVVVTSQDLETGEVVTWRDSVVTFSDGSLGHVFLGTFRPSYGGRYRLEVRRADGARTAANISVPLRVQPFRQATQLVPGDALFPIYWPGALQLNALEMTYELENGSCDRFPFALRFEGEAEPSEFGWTTTVLLGEDAERILEALEGREHAPTRITLRAEVATAEWRAPGGVFDPDLFLEPGTFSNVENGFGFVGAAYAVEVSWTPEPAAITRTAFSLPGFGGCGG